MNPFIKGLLVGLVVGLIFGIVASAATFVVLVLG